MPKLIFDEATRRCTGTIDGAGAYHGPGVVLDVESLPDDLGFLVLDDSGVVRLDAQALLARAQAARIVRIKTEAAALIAATDWKLARAKEREAAGWASLAAVDVILAERESIRRSSNAAEAAVLELTDAADVQAFAWAVDVAVPSPNRVTHATLLDALLALGEDVIPNILAAKDSIPALLQWWTFFDKADCIAGSDPRLLAGLHCLEIAGLIPLGGADAVRAALLGQASPVSAPV